MANNIETEEERLTYKYWQNWIKRAKKLQPVDKWKAAESRLKMEEGSGETARDGNPKPYVSGYRLQYERLKSFLDQTEPTFRIAPSTPFATDQESLMRAEADSAYLKYVWNEQKCQITETKKLDSCLQRNVGYSIPGFDKKKWMPTLRYLAARNVLLDPDCDGNLTNASAQGYMEEISLEEFQSQNPNLTKPELESIIKQAGTVLDSENKEMVVSGPQEKKLYTTVTVNHIFARNDAAVRKPTDDTEEVKEQSIVEELNLSTPKKYLQFVKGYKKPLKEVTGWPYELDDNEFPITVLRFNTPVGSLYGYTDYEQMQRLDQMCDNIMYDIENEAYWEAVKKFAGSENMDLTDVQVEDFLRNPKKTFIPKLLDANGKPKIQEIQLGNPNSDLVNKYQLADEERRKASALGELLHADVKEFKDVTAIAARIHDANVHQTVNRRLGGPEGYEASIAEDAIKLLEIAHQQVPRLSVLEVPKQPEEEDSFLEEEDLGFDYISLPWDRVKEILLQPNTKLVQLGVDAIIGPELAKYWRTTDEYPVQLFKLETRTSVLPGSTRSVTKEQNAAVMKQYYAEIYAPILQTMGRFDLMIKMSKEMGRLAGIDNMDDNMPSEQEAQQFNQQYQQMMQQQAEGEAGGETSGATGSPEGGGA